MMEPRAAVRDALAKYLQDQFEATGAWPKLEISSMWPAPGSDFPAQAITVVAPSQGVTLEYHQPVVRRVTPDASGPKGKVLFSYGIVEMQLQLDVWAGFEAMRDDLAGELPAMLNRAPQDTLGGFRPGEYQLRGVGLMLPIASSFNEPANIQFDPIVTVTDTPTANMNGQWRGTLQGRARMYLLDERHVVLMKTIVFSLGLNGATPELVTIPKP